MNISPMTAKGMSSNGSKKGEVEDDSEYLSNKKKKEDDPEYLALGSFIFNMVTPP